MDRTPLAPSWAGFILLLISLATDWISYYVPIGTSGNQANNSGGAGLYQFYLVIFGRTSFLDGHQGAAISAVQSSTGIWTSVTFLLALPLAVPILRSFWNTMAAALLALCASLSWITQLPGQIQTFDLNWMATHHGGPSIVVFLSGCVGVGPYLGMVASAVLIVASIAALVSFKGKFGRLVAST
jgi:hypothetical protein